MRASFLPSFLPSFHPSFLASFLPSFLPSAHSSHLGCIRTWERKDANLAPYKTVQSHPQQPTIGPGAGQRSLLRAGVSTKFNCLLSGGCHFTLVSAQDCSLHARREAKSKCALKTSHSRKASGMKELHLRFCVSSASCCRSMVLHPGKPNQQESVASYAVDRPTSVIKIWSATTFRVQATTIGETAASNSFILRMAMCLFKNTSLYW